MPTYEYRCEDCDKNYDVVQSFHDEPLESCPTCGSPVRKVFGNVGIVFKGSGFYKTDSRDGKSRAGAEKGGSSGDAAEGGGKPAESGGEKAPVNSTNGSGSTGGAGGADGAAASSPSKVPSPASKSKGD